MTKDKLVTDIKNQMVKGISEKEYLKNKLGELPREHAFYINIIYWLAPIFPSVSNDEIDELSNAAYLYFRFLLAFDEYVDAKKDSEKLEKFLALENGFQNYEDAVRILHDLFSKEVFWEKFKGLKKVYFQTILLEKRLSKNKPEITEEIFQKIARGKSVICLNSVYALQFLADNFEYGNELEACINEIHIALQYIDDIEDFKKDFEEGQWTYPQYLVRDFFNKDKSLHPDEIDIALSHKYLYTTGISDRLFTQAICHFDKAVKISEKLNLKELTHFLKSKMRSIEFHLNEIGFLRAKSIMKSQKSNDFVSGNDISRAIENGVLYLEKNLDVDLTWSDFMTSAGAGKAWITAFVAYQLVEIDSELPVVRQLENNICKNTHDFLSYNEAVIQDGDSTSFIIGFLQKSEIEIPEDILKSWYAFFEPATGGWRTYINEKKLRNLLELEDEVSVEGWLTPKICVSATAAYLLSFTADRVTFNKTCEYLIKNLDGNKLDSYWWTSSVYSTSFAVMAFSQSEKFTTFCKIPANWIASEQDPSGCWLNPFGKEASAFYTALGVKALIVYDFSEFECQIENGVKWLLDNQTLDGSWKTNRILQIPATDIQNAGEVKNWRKSSFGVNCVSDDYNRVFTTSTVVNCLGNYRKRSSHAD